MALDQIVTINPIELRVSNLYAQGRMIIFADGSGELERDKFEYIPTEPDDYYTVKYDDRLTKIAYDFYNNKVELASHYWWIIADANDIENPLDISEYIGKEIIIPNILNFKLKN